MDCAGSQEKTREIIRRRMKGGVGMWWREPRLWVERGKGTGVYGLMDGVVVHGMGVQAARHEGIERWVSCSCRDEEGTGRKGFG